MTTPIKWDDSDQDALPSEILPSKYDVTDIEAVVHSCTHLFQEQQNDLLDILSRFPKLFNNELNIYLHEKIHLDIDPTVPFAYYSCLSDTTLSAPTF